MFDLSFPFELATAPVLILIALILSSFCFSMLSLIQISNNFSIFCVGAVTIYAMFVGISLFLSFKQYSLLAIDSSIMPIGSDVLQDFVIPGSRSGKRVHLFLFDVKTLN